MCKQESIFKKNISKTNQTSNLGKNTSVAGVQIL